ncbi:MAG: T9SS type A sorting domain-containing protein, partial [Bacteroidota bacterium]
FTLISLFLAHQIGFAQSLELSTDNDGALDNEQAVTFEGSPEESTVYAYVFAKNISDEPVDVMVRREEVDLVDGTVNSLCWGSCFAETVDTSLWSITIEPGETSDDFYGDFKPKGNTGTSVIKYYFYDERNPDDEVSVEVHYEITENTNESTLTLIHPESEEIIDYEETLVVNGSMDESLVKARVNIRNDDEIPIDIKVRRVENSLIPETDNYFCWGACFGSSVDTSTISLTIEPGEVSEEFYGDYLHEGHEGTSSVSYYFYDERNPENETGIEIHYKVESTGIEDLDAIKELQVFPVPADRFLKFRINWKQNPENAQINIFDRTGKVILTKPVDNAQETKINTAKLKNGIYFYSITEQNKVIATDKFVVAH